jgi:hypothetical protein
MSTTEERGTNKFVSKMGAQKRRPQPIQNVLSSIPDKGVSCNSRTKHERKMEYTKVDCFEEETTERMLKSLFPKFSWVRFTEKVFSLARRGCRKV